ncbi:deoxyribodipyrimidine photo-lyase [Acinetobacter seifertii]|uniref:Deoxyribodipyrimidine photo-lyase n=1 Tax=Acinetobacter seifertii TaxID=1530123 RepID=A0A7H2TCV9_9GAMM|nr:deoxyribodipyrimidine photo-lyase [Acinetobacter seifertii]QNX49692.1 deoxyribodipyrimidine photo-lyase [Acinetobacter seifertii]QNY18132.1 deoxyribodipyrimidine photo-lyase [Acinetobacter seifertii]
MSNAYQLIWFRQDLRVRDHAALWHACQQGNSIALVILSPDQWKQHDDAPIKISFYLRQLKKLQEELAALHIPLVIQVIPYWKDIAKSISDFSKKYNIENVYANIEVGVNELKRDKTVQDTLNKDSKELFLFHDRTIFPLRSIRNKSEQPYQVFSAFKKVCYSKLDTSGLPQCYPLPNKQTKVPTDLLEEENTNLAEIEKLFCSSITTEQQDLWPVGDSYALEQLDHFIEDSVSHYKVERDFPHITGTSKLSPYLNIGILSTRQCLQALFRSQHGNFHLTNEGQQTWLDELIWREFYQHILFDFPYVSKHIPFKKDTQKIQWNHNPEHLTAWQTGQTGIPIVDAGMRQLLQTGWMHNRVRMITAMFLCKNLLIDWRIGEQWFMQHLIDGDLAANNGGWQWCASTGTDAVPYFRIFNPISQSQKFDPNGDYIRTWVKELAHLDNKSIHDPYSANKFLRLNYPKPIVDLKETRLKAIETFKRI